jgi:hypothetical protein
MDRYELTRAVRNTYSHAMKAHHSTEAAISECAAIVRQHSPEAGDPEARKLIAKMIAEEPLG